MLRNRQRQMDCDDYLLAKEVIGGGVNVLLAALRVALFGRVYLCLSPIARSSNG